MKMNSLLVTTTKKATAALKNGNVAKKVATKSQQFKGASALMYACQQGDVERVRRIIKNNPNIHLERDRSGKSALHYCCCSENIRAAQAADLLVMAAPELVDGRDQDGFTPLHLAVIAGNMPLVTFLLANKADVNAVDNEKHTVVHWATVCGETGALRAVLEAGAPVSTPDLHGGYPLHYAAQMCGGERDSELGLQVLHTLLSHHDIVVSVEDGDGRQPLLWAASAGSAKAILALVKAGASVEAPDKDGLTALHCAASRGHTDCIDSLLTLCGASPDIIDCNGCTALHYAVTLGHADATALLLAHGSDPNRQDRKGRSPAHCGCAKGQLETVKMIGAHGANLWLRNARGDLPLHEAAASGRRELVKWLLESRPSQVNARNNDGRCPLHLAALNDNADMCKILLDSGAQINPVLRTSKNVFMTPLDCALQRGFRSTAKFLQLHGGLPANRLASNNRHEQNPINSTSSLHIRDDVTFWASTTDSERENADESTEKSRRRSLKRRFAYKYENRKKDPDCGGDKENSKTHTKNGMKVPKSSTREDKKNETLCYSSEVKIGTHRSEFKVERNGEISMGVKSTTPTSSGRAETKEKRPKSAKYSRVRKSATKTNDVATKSTSTEDSNNNLSDSQHKAGVETVESSTQIVEEKVDSCTQVEADLTKEKTTEPKLASIGRQENIVEANDLSTPSNIDDDKKAPSPKGDTGETLQTHYALSTNVDQQSLTSYEENEENKNLVVEASIHSPPKVAVDKAQTPVDLDVEENPRTKTDTEVKSPQVEPQRGTVENHTKSKEEVATNSVEGHTKESTEDTLRSVKESQKIKEVDDKNDGKSNSEENVDDGPSRNAIEAIIIDDSYNPVSCTDTTARVNDQNLEGDNKINVDDDKVEDSGLTTDECDTNVSKSFEVLDLVVPNGDVIKDGLPKTTTDSAKNVQKKKRPIVPKDSLQIHHNRSSEDTKSSDDDDNPSSISTSSSLSRKTHRSFTVLDDDHIDKVDVSKDTKNKRKTKKTPLKKMRSRSEENDTRRCSRKTKIPAPVNLKSTPRSKSDRCLDKTQSGGLESKLPSLPNLTSGTDQNRRPDSNKSAPVDYDYSDEQKSASDLDEKLGSARTRRRVKKRQKNRGAKSAGSDYESSNLIDSGFEPSPRSSRIPKWRNMSERGVNMTSVTQSIQTNIRRYHLERKIFQHLLELKRLQIRSNQHNEAILVKRAIDAYHNSCASTVGAGRYVPDDFTFKSFEKFLYQSLRKLQKNGAEHLKGLPETPNPLFCTQSTHRCSHATHAYTGIPCAAYLPKMDHHTIPKIGFSCKPSSGFLPQINQKKVTLELCHGNDKQVISLPADRLDQNKRYYVTFTVKGHDDKEPQVEEPGHRHSKSD